MSTESDHKWITIENIPERVPAAREPSEDSPGEPDGTEGLGFPCFIKGYGEWGSAWTMINGKLHEVSALSEDGAFLRLTCGKVPKRALATIADRKDKPSCGDCFESWLGRRAGAIHDLFKNMPME